MLLVRKMDSARDIIREHRRVQTVRGVVYLAQHVVLIIKPIDVANWPEDTLLYNARVCQWPRIGKVCWLDPVDQGAP